MHQNSSVDKTKKAESEAVEGAQEPNWTGATPDKGQFTNDT